MKFWLFCLVGVVASVVAKILIDVRNSDKDDEENSDESDIYFGIYPDNISKKLYNIIMFLLATLSINLVGGILVAKFIGNFANSIESLVDIFFMLSFTFIVSCFVYITLFCWLLHNFESILQIVFLVIFISSIISWSIPIWNYNQNITKEVVEDVETVKQYELLYFDNVPVQRISGEFSGDITLGTGSIEGEITSKDEITYWYLKDGAGVYGTVDTGDLKIIFIEDEESPYLEIKQYTIHTVVTNNNNGTEKDHINKVWTEYYFYLPTEIMQYNLDILVN